MNTVIILLIVLNNIIINDPTTINNITAPESFIYQDMTDNSTIVCSDCDLCDCDCDICD